MLRFKRPFILSLISFWLSVAFVAECAVTKLSNGALRVVLSENGARIIELTELPGEVNLLDGKSPHHLWSINATGGNGKMDIQPGHAKSFRSENIPGTEPGLRLIWDQFDVTGATNLKVIATLLLDAKAPMSRWSIAVENIGDLSIGNVRFPILGGIRERKDEQLAVPVWLGQQTAEARRVLGGSQHQGARFDWDYPGHVSLQCVSFSSSDGPSFYAACDDAEALRKTFTMWGDGKSVFYEMVHLPESTVSQSKRYATPYNAIIGTFRGDWITAAEIYRSWGTNQPWADQSRLQNKQVPGWVTETGMWVWNRGRSEGVLSPALALQKELDLPVSVFWHWWHGCPYDTGFPEYLPPREGAEPFRKALATAHKKDVHAIVYMNQRLWGMTTESWKSKGAEQFAVKGENGKVNPEVYNVFTKQACASMCLHTPFWRDTYAEIAEEAIEDLKVDGIYMDQACSSLACYDPSHGHPLGGGSYWIKGFQKLSTDIRKRVDQKAALAGEGCGEAWLPYLDIMLALQVARERYAAPKDGWQVIPFFSAVYHPYAVLYGNYSSLTEPPYDELWPAEFAPKEPLKLLPQKFSQQFYLEQARSFVWGQQPTIANFRPEHFEQRKEESEYFMRLAKIRSRAMPYLLHGTFLRPPEIEVPSATIPLSRLSIYAGQKGGVTLSEGSFPMIVSGAWKATDRNVGVALASISNEPISFPLHVSRSTHRLGNRGKIYRTDEKGRKRIGEWKDGNAEIELKFAARDACVIEFVSK